MHCHCQRKTKEQQEKGKEEAPTRANHDKELLLVLGPLKEEQAGHVDTERGNMRNEWMGKQRSLGSVSQQYDTQL